MKIPNLYSLRILHVSDLHAERSSLGPKGWSRRWLLGERWRECLDDLTREGQFDLVCFTGDIAKRGVSEEYEEATRFLKQIHEQLSLELTRFFVIPGNHDVDRRIAVDAWATVRSLPDSESRVISSWFAGGTPPRAVDSALRAAVLARGNSYRTWVRDVLGRPDLLPDGSTGHPHLGYRSTIRISRLPFPIYVIGLDSSWLSGDDCDASNIRLTSEQVGQLSHDLEGEVGAFRLALIHHPLASLRDGDEVRDLLAARTDLLLRGHLHEPRLALWSDPDRQLREVAAGCLYEHDTYPNSFQVLNLALDRHGRMLHADMDFRTWSKRGFWYADSSAYRGTKHGRLRWPSEADNSLSSSPLSGVFVGRQAELRKLSNILMPKGRRAPAPNRPTVVTIQGMAGVGKSYLADRFAIQHSVEFPDGYIKLSLSPNDPRSAEELGADIASRLRQIWSPEQGWERLRLLVLGRRILIHLENIDSEAVGSAVGLLVRRMNAGNVVTSGRLLGLGEDAGWAQLRLGPLAPKDAMRLLATESHAAIAEDDLRQVAEAVGNLPLALHLAAGHLRHGLSTSRFLVRMREQSLRIGPADPADPRVDELERVVLRSTFELSLRALSETLGGAGSRLIQGFAALGHVVPSGVGISLGRAISDLSINEFDDLMSEAVRHSLVTKTRSDKRLDCAWEIHPLVAEFLRRESGHEIDWLSRMTDWFVERLPRDGEGESESKEPAGWVDVMNEYDSLRSLLLNSTVEGGLRLERAGFAFAIRRGPYDAWISFCERLLRESIDPEARSNVLFTLAHVTNLAGALDRTEAAVREKRELDTKRNDAREAIVASGMMVEVLRKRGHLAEALRVLNDDILPFYERGRETRALAVTRARIARIMVLMENPAEALELLLKDVIPAFVTLEDARERALAWITVAEGLIVQGRFDDASNALEHEALAVAVELNDLRIQATIHGKVAEIAERRGNFDEAIRIREEIEHPTYVRLENWSDLTVGRFELARCLIKRSGAEDRARARVLLESVIRDATSMRLRHLEEMKQLLASIIKPPP